MLLSLSSPKLQKALKLEPRMCVRFEALYKSYEKSE